MSDAPLDLSSLNLNSEPSPPVRYFDLLPPELVIDIVEHATSSYNYNDERDRRGTLRALCLTSRRLHSIAHPLLLSHIDLRSETLIERLVENNTADALSRIRTIRETTFGDFGRLGLAAMLIRATNKLEALRCFRIYTLKPFLGSNIRFLSIDALLLKAQDVPLFRFQHLRSMDLSRCKLDEQIRYDLPSLRHLVYRHANDREVTGNHLFLDYVARTLVSISVSGRSSLPDSIINNPSISLCRLDTLVMGVPANFNLRPAKVLYLNTGMLDFTSLAATTLGAIDSWTNLLSVHLKPEVLLLDEAEVSAEYIEYVQRLEETCRRRGIEVVWEKHRRIHPTFRFGSRWFIEWSEKHRRE